MLYMEEGQTTPIFELIRQGNVDGLKDFIGEQRRDGTDMAKLLNNSETEMDLSITPLGDAILYYRDEKTPRMPGRPVIISPSPEPLAIVKFLLEQPELNVNGINYLAHCCYRGDFQVIEYLLERDEVVFSQDTIMTQTELMNNNEIPKTPLGYTLNGLNKTLTSDLQERWGEGLRTPDEYYKIMRRLMLDRRMVIPLREKPRYFEYRRFRDPAAKQLMRDYFTPGGGAASGDGDGFVCDIDIMNADMESHNSRRCTISGGKKYTK